MASSRGRLQLLVVKFLLGLTLLVILHCVTGHYTTKPVPAIDKKGGHVKVKASPAL
jgi:hypothetical protein